MLLFLRRCALPLAAAFLLLSSAACGDSGEPAARISDPAVDSSDTRTHSLARLVGRADTLSTLAEALRQAGLMQDLREGGPYTLFAPTDEAFRRYMPGFDSLIAPAGTSAAARPGTRNRRGNRAGNGEAPAAPYRDSLRQVLQFHLVNGRFGPGAITDSLRLGTVLPGQSFAVERLSGGGMRARANASSSPSRIRRTVRAQNGIIYILGRPLRIPAPDTTAEGALQSSEEAPASSGAN